jgi:hypothetical protein
MTKVSWKRILQRAGNDLPSHGRQNVERPHLQSVPARQPRRGRAAAEPSSAVPGELESELRRALQRAQGGNPEPQETGWDPIFMEQELRHQAVAPVPAGVYSHPAVKRRSATRSLLAVSLSAVVVGFVVQQIGEQWRDSHGGGGGGGGNGGGGGQHRAAEPASIAAPLRGKDQTKLVQTGYAIQPLANPSPADLDPTLDNRQVRDESRSLFPQERHTVDPATTFQRDMEEARKLFDNNQERATPAKAAPPAVTVRAAPPAPKAETPAEAADWTPSPAQIAAATPPRAEQKPQPEARSKARSSGEKPSPASPEETKLLDRANDLMQRGDITGARLLYEHLARRGSALGAFALAQSYDPKFLQKLYVRGLSPDAKQADYWYQRAAELNGGAAPGKR